MKILKGNGYTKARLAGIMHEMYVAESDKIPPPKNITQYGNGNVIEIKTKKVVDKEEVEEVEYALILDENSKYYKHLPAVHRNVERLKDYVVPVTEEV